MRPHAAMILAGTAWVGCAVSPTTQPAEVPAQEQDVLAGPPSNRKPGDVLAATVPLLAGGAVELESLRGRAVVLELSATWAKHFEDAHRVYRQLLDRHGDAELAVVAVALDTERGPLEGYWADRPAPFVLGWDPQGALAARLQAAELPTVFVLDRAGRILHVQAGFAPSDAKIIGNMVANALGAAPPPSDRAGDNDGHGQ